MSLPWFKMDTQAVLAHRDLRIAQGRKATDLEGAVEVFALLACGRLASMSLNATAQTLGWTRKKVRRVISQWPDHTGQLTGIDRPDWWATVPKKYQEHTAPTGQPRGNQGATKGHTRARSSFKEKEEEEEIPIPAWKITAWETLCASIGKSSKLCRLTPARQRQLSQCAKVAREFSQPGERAEETLIAYLRDIPISANRWLVDRSPSVETPIKPRKVRSYLEAWKGSRGPEPADLTAAISAHLQREIRKHGRSDPPRRRQQDGSWLVCWRFEAPGGVEDTPAYDEALNAALRASGGWGGLFRSPRDQQFAIRDTARRAGETLRGVSPARFVKQ